MGIQYWEDTLNDEISAIKSLLNNLPSNDFDKTSALKKIDGKLRGAKSVKKSFKMECRLVADATAKKEFEDSLARYDEEISQIKSDLRALQEEQRRNEVFAGSAEQAEQGGVEAGDKLLAETKRIQDNTQSSLDHTKQLIEE